MSIEKIGFYGAYYRTCKVIKEGFCKGCKIGYDTGMQDISNTKCKMKVCFIQKGHNCCVDCSEYDSCDIIQGFFAKNGYK